MITEYQYSLSKFKLSAMQLSNYATENNRKKESRMNIVPHSIKNTLKLKI